MQLLFPWRVARNPEQLLLSAPFLPHPYLNEHIFFRKWRRQMGREESFSHSPIRTSNLWAREGLLVQEAAPEPHFHYCLWFIHGYFIVTSPCSACVLQPFPPYISDSSMPPKIGFRKRKLIPLQPLSYSLIKPFSSIPHSKDVFSTSWACCQAISAHRFGK